MKRIWRLVIAGGVVAIGIAAGIVWYLQAQSAKLPADIKSQLDFAAHLPGSDLPGYTLKPESIKLSRIEDARILNYVLVGDGRDITLSQQAYPEALIYDKFTASLNPDATVGTRHGALTIGHPKDARGQQVAGMKIGDTLLLARPTRDLSQDEWRSVINSLEPAR